jgi:hypothetical protein
MTPSPHYESTIVDTGGGRHVSQQQRQGRLDTIFNYGIDTGIIQR